MIILRRLVVFRLVSDLLMSRNSAEPMGQVPDSSLPAQLAPTAPWQVGNLPHIDSEIPGDLRRSESSLPPAGSDQATIFLGTHHALRFKWHSGDDASKSISQPDCGIRQPCLIAPRPRSGVEIETRSLNPSCPFRLPRLILQERCQGRLLSRCCWSLPATQCSRRCQRTRRRLCPLVAGVTATIIA
jgi:hypothetical protein